MDPFNIQRLQNEYRLVEQAIDNGNLQNVTVEVAVEKNTNNYKLWNCVIYGREGTIWEGGEFKGQMIFSDNYPQQPPEYKWKGYGNVKFYHMNVYSSGRTCLDILNKDGAAYSPTKTMVEILSALERFLYEPNPKSPTDGTQAKLYENDKPQYEKLIKEFVKKYMQFKE